MADSADCDDTSEFTHPGAAALDSATECMRDVDEDGYGDTSPPAGVTAGTDCDDADPATHPGAVEINDGKDNQCEGEHGHGVSDELSGDSGGLSPLQ